MKKNTSIIVGIIVAIVILAGGYMLMHKSNKNNNTPSNTSSSSAPAVNNAVLATKTVSGIGQYLADPNGKTLYTYGGDTRGVSNCTGSCLANWPAYVAKGATTNLPSGVGVITRSDNSQKQYTYNGMPLYYFVSDSTGKVTGDGVENFHVAKPAAAASSSSSTQPASTSPQPSSTPTYKPY